MEKLPTRYLDEFLRQKAALIKSRVRLSVAVFLSTFIIGGALANLAIYGAVSQELMFTWLFAILICAVALFLARRAATLRRAKISAALLILMLLFTMVSFHIKESVPPFYATSIYLIMLFAITFIFPWLTREITGIALLHLGIFSFYFYSVPTYIYKNHTYYSDFSDYIQGFVLLSVATCICLVISKHEREREVENFILLKRVEDNNRQMQKELNLATRVHKTLIPKSLNSNLVDVAVMYLPMYYMGGDYARFNFIDKNRLIFIICDVTGHGVSAALLVNRLHAEFERISREGKQPGVLLKELNDFITKDFAGTNMYLSAFCGLLDFTNRKLYYSNRGHPAQYIYRITKSDILQLSSQATWLGIDLYKEELYQAEIEFNKGDKVLLFTDGVTETKNKQGEEYGGKRLEGFVKNNHSLQARKFNQKLVDELNGFKTGEFADDVFILSIDIK
ncbi:MAG: serine/threonine-protein phosphatase [Candidatus Omnitrophica bacterium]|nr:serine/threonine-protein phosphatase [Candidatus Omnitrophota bacterium]